MIFENKKLSYLIKLKSSYMYMYIYVCMFMYMYVCNMYIYMYGCIYISAVKVNVLITHLSHYFIFIQLSDYRNSKIYQWKQFYWEFSWIKIQYVGTERETNVIINNKCTFCLFRRSELPCPAEKYLLCAKKRIHLHKASIFVHAHVD